MNFTRPTPAAPARGETWSEQKLGRATWLVLDAAATPELRAALKDKHSLTAPPAKLLYTPEEPESCRLYRTHLPGIAAELVLKFFPVPRKWRRLKNACRTSRAHRAFLNALLLRKRGIATPLPVAAGEIRHGPLLRESWLITQAILPATTLVSLFNPQRRIPTAALEREGALLGHLHEAGFSQRDLKDSNVLFDTDLQPWLIDLDALRRFQRMPAWRAERDLVRLGREFLAAPPAVLRWSGRRLLRAYLAARGRGQHARTLDHRLSRALLEATVPGADAKKNHLTAHR